MKLEQRVGLFQKSIYEIADKNLLISRKTLTGGGTATYPIFELSDATVREFKRQWGWIVAAILCFLPSFSFISDAIALDETYPLFPATFFWVLSGALVLMYFQKSYDLIIFKQWRDNSGLFTISNNKPNKEEFDAFYNALLREIRKTKVNPQLSLEQKLEVYADYLQFLVDEEVVTEEEAKSLLSRKQKALSKEKSNIIGIV